MKRSLLRLIPALFLLLFIPTSLFANNNPVVAAGGGFGLESLMRGIIGMAFIIFIAWIFSTNRKAISWKVVLTGLAIQLTLALAILYVPFVQSAFDILGKIFVKILSFSDAGAQFLFKSLTTGEIEEPLLNFAITILPTIIFFSGLTSILFYFGIIQKVVYFLALGMTKLLRISGP
ncbi:Na+ dependent nucleoside transporter N-terminal domain-containing protein, partial [Marinilabilia sp.]